jgi:hypothetical protein
MKGNSVPFPLLFSEIFWVPRIDYLRRMRQCGGIKDMLEIRLKMPSER